MVTVFSDVISQLLAVAVILSGPEHPVFVKVTVEVRFQSVLSFIVVHVKAELDL